MADNERLNDCRCGQSVQSQTQQTEEQSFAMQMLKEATKNGKRWFIVSITILAMWLATIGAFLVYLNQYEVVEETSSIEQNTNSGGDIGDSYVGIKGDITNGIPENNTK